MHARLVTLGWLRPVLLGACGLLGLCVLSVAYAWRTHTRWSLAQQQLGAWAAWQRQACEQVVAKASKGEYDRLNLKLLNCPQK
jgi:hypothetical protein